MLDPHPTPQKKTIPKKPSLIWVTKTWLSKPLFKEILQFCRTIIILQILVKKPFKYLLKFRS